MVSFKYGVLSLKSGHLNSLVIKAQSMMLFLLLIQLKSFLVEMIVKLKSGKIQSMEKIRQ